MVGKTWLWLVVPMLACVVEDPDDVGFRAAVKLTESSSETTSETTDATATASTTTTFGAESSSGPDPDPLPDKSFRDAEDPVDVFTRGCVAEYSDKTCGTRTKVHADRCYSQPQAYDYVIPRPSSREMFEVFTFEDGEECDKDTCCLGKSETVVDCWKECQNTEVARVGYCEESPVCPAGKPGPWCDAVACFGETPAAAKCVCKDSPSSRDSDGFDPGTRGCLTEYATAGCGGGATKHVTDTCLFTELFEKGARSTDLGQGLPANDCGTKDSEEYNCPEWCKGQGHKTGTCEEADIMCGGAMMKSGKCVCTN